MTVKNGWVTIEGKVDWQYQKALAESSVKKLKGVLGVIDHINVTPIVTPTEIKSKIEEALKRSAEIDARRITVEVEERHREAVRQRAIVGGAGGSNPRGMVRSPAQRRWRTFHHDHSVECIPVCP